MENNAVLLEEQASKARSVYINDILTADKLKLNSATKATIQHFTSTQEPFTIQ